MADTGQLADRLAAHVEALAGRIGERNLWRPGSLAAAAGYVREYWSRLGYAVAEQTYPVRESPCVNLEIVLGDRGAGPQLVVGAHYDTVPGSPGADDNASGVAALLELGRLLQETPLNRPVRLVTFVNEEEPFFATESQGSVVYAGRARQAGQDIELMVSLEMLGYYSRRRGSQAYPPLLRYFYPDRGDFIAMVSDLRSSRQLRRFVRAFRRASSFPAEQLAAPPVVPGLDLSDHRSFWQAGYPAIMVTDTAFYRNPYYHTAADTPDTLSYPDFAELTAGLAGAIAILAA